MDTTTIFVVIIGWALLGTWISMHIPWKLTLPFMFVWIILGTILLNKIFP